MRTPEQDARIHRLLGTWTGKCQSSVYDAGGGLVLCNTHNKLEGHEVPMPPLTDADAMMVLRKLAEYGQEPDVGYSKHPQGKGLDWYCDLGGAYSDQIGADDPAEAIFAAADAYIKSLEK